LKYNNDIIKILDKGEAYYAGMVGKWVLRKKPVRFIRLPVEQLPKLKL
jgi:hypothetical protein